MSPLHLVPSVSRPCVSQHSHEMIVDLKKLKLKFVDESKMGEVFVVVIGTKNTCSALKSGRVSDCQAGSPGLILAAHLAFYESITDTSLCC